MLVKARKRTCGVGDGKLTVVVLSFSQGKLSAPRSLLGESFGASELCIFA